MLRTLEIKVNRFMVKELPKIIITPYLLHWINVFPCDWKTSSMILIKWYKFSRPPVFHVKCRSQNYIKSLLHEKVKTREMRRLYQVTPSTVSSDTRNSGAEPWFSFLFIGDLKTYCTSISLFYLYTYSL